MKTQLNNIDDAESREAYGGLEIQMAKQVGLTQFGVNRVVLPPGCQSSRRHWHEEEDEFVYVLEGALTLIDENGPHPLRAGSFVGFPAGAANAHHLVNASEESATFFAVGTRHRGEERIHYPDNPEVGVATLIRDARGEHVKPDS